MPTNSWGRMLLALWLIASGVIALLNIAFPGRDPLLALVAVAAGALLLWERGRVSWRVRMDILALGVWLLGSGLSALLRISFLGHGALLSALAIVAGALLVIRR